jgi:hypothetical protein
MENDEEFLDDNCLYLSDLNDAISDLVRGGGRNCFKV